ncbi:MAG: hypothetical protein ACREQ4_18570 [Candidatus Binataceae bacterium]
MKRGLSLVAAGLIAGPFAFSTVGFAQSAPPSPPPQVTIVSGGAPASDLPMSEYKAFSEFQSEHPEIVRRLSHNPRLLHSRGFQAKNPALLELFNNHPGLQTAMEQNPGNFLSLAPGVTTGHHAWRHHHMMRHKAAAHSESSSSSATSGGGAAKAPAASSDNPPAGVNAPSGESHNGTGAGETGGNGMGGSDTGGAGGGSSNHSGNM